MRKRKRTTEERAAKAERAAKKAAKKAKKPAKHTTGAVKAATGTTTATGYYQLRRLSGKPLRKYLKHIGHTKDDAAKLAASIPPVTKYKTFRDCLCGQNCGGVPGIVLEMHFPDGRVQEMITAC